MKIKQQVLLLLLFAIISPEVFAQKAVRGVRKGVVKVVKYDQDDLNKDGFVGTGFIVGNEGSTFFIATALHNVTYPQKRGGRAPADSIIVEFPSYTQNGERIVQAELAGDYNEALDLAVLKVQLSYGERYQGYQFRMSDKETISGGNVVAAGFPTSREGEFSLNDLNSAIKSNDPNRIEFTSKLITGGNSGGPLFIDRSYRLIGMVLRNNGPDIAEASKIEDIKFYLDKWEIPTNLLSTPVERRTLFCGTCTLLSLGTGFYFNNEADKSLDIYKTFASDEAARRAEGKDRQALYDEYQNQRTMRNIAYGAGIACALYETAHQLGWIGEKRRQRREEKGLLSPRSSWRVLPGAPVGIQLTYVRTF